MADKVSSKRKPTGRSAAGSGSGRGAAKPAASGGRTRKPPAEDEADSRSPDTQPPDTRAPRAKPESKSKAQGRVQAEVPGQAKSKAAPKRERKTKPPAERVGLSVRGGAAPAPPPGRVKAQPPSTPKAKAKGTGKSRAKASTPVMAQAPVRVLAAHRDVGALRQIREAVTERFHAEIDTSPLAERAFELALQRDYQLFFLDADLPEIRGELLYEMIEKAYRYAGSPRFAPAVAYVFNAVDSEKTKELRRDARVKGVLAQPLRKEKIIEVCQNVLPPKA